MYCKKIRYQIKFIAESYRSKMFFFVGHTHAGQFYTFAPLAYFHVPYFHGLYNLSSRAQLFVTAGTLYQGPPMKMLQMSEIWIITITRKAVKKVWCFYHCVILSTVAVISHEKGQVRCSRHSVVSYDYFVLQFWITKK